MRSSRNHRERRLAALKNVRTMSFALCAVLVAVLFTACDGYEVRDDVPVSELSQAIEAVLGKDEFVPLPESYILGSMKIDVSDYDGYDVKINSKGVNIDEYGIFKAETSDLTAPIEQAVKDYIQLRKDTWMTEYMPEEFPKLENAEFKTVGSYVMYAILSDDDKKAAFAAFENDLKV
jgi:hypothetical protein